MATTKVPVGDEEELGGGTVLPGGEDEDEDEAEGDSLIELVSSSSSTTGGGGYGDDGGGGRRRISRPLGSATRWDNASSPARRLATLLRGGGSSISNSHRSACLAATASVLLLAGVFHLGRLEAKKEVGLGSDAKSSSTNKAAAGTFTRRHLDATRAEASKLLSYLDDYYSGADVARDMLTRPWLDPWVFDDVRWPEKRDRNAKLVDTMARALASDDQGTFLVGAIGSSVMAGHDNCHYDGYQSQMERLWSPVWEAAGMGFAIQNAGEGGGCGDSFQNQGMCITQNVSPNVDIGE
jgi:hypothetical protein